MIATGRDRIDGEMDFLARCAGSGGARGLGAGGATVRARAWCIAEVGRNPLNYNFLATRRRRTLRALPQAAPAVPQGRPEFDRRGPTRRVSNRFPAGCPVDCQADCAVDRRLSAQLDAQLDAQLTAQLTDFTLLRQRAPV
jgi:hypothetical protein